MATIISDEFRISNAIDFINKYKYDLGSSQATGTTGALSNNLYFGLGRNITNAWPDENVPGALTQGAQEITDFWSRMYALALIPNSDMELVVPRYSWQEMQAGTVTPVVFTPVNSVSSYSQPFYCVNTDLATLRDPTQAHLTNHFQVYQLLVKGAGLPANRPVHTTTTGVLEADGYNWKYLYTLTTYQIDNMVTETATGAGDWLPVQYEYAGSSTDSGTTGANDLIARTLGASNVMLRRVILDSEILQADLESFREVCLVANPLSTSGTRASVAQGYVNGGVTNTQTNSFTNNSGEMLYMETRRPIYRTAGQSEEIKLVLDF